MLPWDPGSLRVCVLQPLWLLAQLGVRRPGWILARLRQARPRFCQISNCWCPFALLHTFFRSGTLGILERGQCETGSQPTDIGMRLSHVCLLGDRWPGYDLLPAGDRKTVCPVRTQVFMEDWRPVPSLHGRDIPWGACPCVYPALLPSPTSGIRP